MQYQAKCNYCGRDFKIKAQGGQRVKCPCPYCGNSVTVWLPDTAKNNLPIQGSNAGNSKRKNRNGAKIFLTALLVVVAGVAIGLGVWYVYQQNANERLLNERLREAYRKAHRDSLTQVRMEQDARRHEAEEKEIREKSIGNFIKSFYLDAIFGDNNVSIYENNITERCRETLRSSYEGECETAECLDWGMFAPDDGESDFNSLRRNLYVSHYMDDWYKVRMVQHGHTEYRYIKVLIIDGNIKIDDVK